MRLAHAAAIILAMALTLIASFSVQNTTAAQTDCVQPLTATTTEGTWSTDCTSSIPAPHGSGDRYARFYTFTFDAESDVTIDLSSDEDTFLYLRNGITTDGDTVADNDDIDTANRDLNSRIVETLAAGDYTIEATTYNAGRTGTFTLALNSTPVSDTDPPDPDPTPTLPACVESLPDNMTVNGTWNTDCTSDLSAPSGSGDRYARFYTFTLSAESDVTIDLSSDEDTFLYLRSGITTDGDTVADNDDRATGDYDSQIISTLQPNSYTIEATTYAAGTTGSFTLTVTVVPASDTTTPEPPDPPTPDPTPGDPTSPIPAGCTLQNFSGTSVDDSWTSDCVSSNRTENGTHYAKFFSFSVSRSATYDLTLESPTDTYLILLSESGDIIDEDDDDEDDVFDLRSRSSGIRIALDPGNYIVEATTFAGTATGDFTLTIIRPELAALHALYNATDGANWINSGNWLSDAPLSDWHGIKTDDEGRITEIYLIGNNLSGEIPAELGRLSQLEGLYLAGNELSGSIPPELGDLYNLEVLMLFDNDLTGAIPYQFGNLESLEVMHLSRNQLSGRIPTQLGNLENLRRLHLTVNDLSGSIPASLGNLTNLRQLSIAANDLTGSIPSEIADLTELTHIYLWGNDLFASSFISNLDNLTNLQWLDIGGNQLDGADVLPKISSLTNLTGLGLHDSGLTDDDLQDYMADLEALDLEFLNISGNDLSDPQTLVGLSRITTIQRLAINDNDFSGELPSTMTRLTFMRLFYFHDNAGLCAPADDDFQDWLVAARKSVNICAAVTRTSKATPALAAAPPRRPLHHPVSPTSSRRCYPHPPPLSTHPTNHSRRRTALVYSPPGRPPATNAFPIRERSPPLPLGEGGAEGIYLPLPNNRNAE